MQSSNLPLISIVVATYNGAQYLDVQMQSLVKQTYPHLEIVVVDDGSSDATRGILEKYQREYSFVHLHYNPTNLGYVKNFEKGCSLAKGAFIALCDQDDYWHREKVEKLYYTIGDHSMAFCNSTLCDENLESIGVTIADRVNSRPYYNCLEQAVFCRIYGHATLITRELAEKATPFLTMIPHDWWLCYMATLLKGITYLPESLVKYRQHSANLLGAVGGKRRKKDKQYQKDKKKKEITNTRLRIQAFYEACSPDKVHEKEVLKQLTECYQSFSLRNNFKRMFLFFRYYPLLLAPKKRTGFRNILFCLKTFTRVV